MAADSAVRAIREFDREGIVYYLRAGTVRGVLLWNVWEKVEVARSLISGARTFTSAEPDSAIPMWLAAVTETR
jgi:3-phenylpropionate/trans-cinnamate dioxygenase ferredoxin reductase subunit